jgi:hypothetical protein
VTGENLHLLMTQIAQVSKMVKRRNISFSQPIRGRRWKMFADVISKVRHFPTEEPFMGSTELAQQITEEMGIAISAAKINSIRKMRRFRQ